MTFNIFYDIFLEIFLELLTDLSKISSRTVPESWINLLKLLNPLTFDSI